MIETNGSIDVVEAILRCCGILIRDLDSIERTLSTLLGC